MTATSRSRTTSFGCARLPTFAASGTRERGRRRWPFSTPSASADVVVIGPSNPIVSIGPILALDGIREALASASVPRIAVSPIVAGAALKGPADRMLGSLGHEVSALGVARLYAGLVDRFVLDEADAHLAPDVEALGMDATVLPTVMRSDADRAALAKSLLA